MTDAIEELHRLWDDALISAVDTFKSADTKKASQSEVKKQARALQRKDPSKLTEKDLMDLLRFAEDEILDDDTYIPVRINTPQILIAFAKDCGYTLENNPLAMRVYKARQALSNEENWNGDFKDKPHDLSPEDIIEIIKATNNPTYLVFQTENERFAEIVKFDKEGSPNKAYAIIDFSDVNKNPDLMNGFKGGKYNILVTVYPSESSAELKKYLSKKEHKVVTGEEMKKKGKSQGSYGGNTPSLLNDSPFYDDSISQKTDESNSKPVKKQSRNITEIDRDYMSAVENGDMETAQRLIDEAAEIAGYKVHAYHGTLSNKFTVFEKSFIGMQYY